MFLLDRIDFIEKLSKEKQLLYTILSSERTYWELYKVCPTYLEKHTNFREVLDELWKYIAGKSQFSIEDWKNIFLVINKKYEKKSRKLVDLSLLETARVINFALASIVWNSDISGTSANSVEKSREVISLIYEEKIEYNSRNNNREMSMKELEWSTKALNLIAESDELPINYSWFTEKIPEYERGEISKKLVEKYKDLE